MRPALAALAAVLVALSVGSGAASAEHAMPDPERKYPRCFGAAARDPVKPCNNPALKRRVTPKPAEAALDLNSPCEFGGREGVLNPCLFGVAPEEATETIALIGDSHAAHWRAALDHVMFAKHWYGVSMTKPGCPFSTAVSQIPEPGRTECAKFKRQLFRWFERHPEVTTVVTSNHTGGKVVGPGDDYAAHVEGYTEAIGKLPATVEHVFSIQDVPRNPGNTSACVAKAIREKRPAGPACAGPRRNLVGRDPAAEAALRHDPARVQHLDLNRFMCARLCMPVIGGALVHKDQTHLTRIFATTLGPYLLRHMDRALSHMATGTRP